MYIVLEADIQWMRKPHNALYCRYIGLGMGWTHVRDNNTCYYYCWQGNGAVPSKKTTPKVHISIQSSETTRSIQGTYLLLLVALLWGHGCKYNGVHVIQQNTVSHRVSAHVASGDMQIIKLQMKMALDTVKSVKEDILHQLNILVGLYTMVLSFVVLITLAHSHVL